MEDHLEASPKPELNKDLNLMARRITLHSHETMWKYLGIYLDVRTSVVES